MTQLGRSPASTMAIVSLGAYPSALNINDDSNPSYPNPYPVLPTGQCEVVVDQINNAIMLKRRPGVSEVADPATEYITPTDRNRKPIPKRYTTERVEGAVGDYLAAVDGAVAAVRRTLQALSDQLKQDLPALVTSIHVAVVLQAAAAHVAAARQRGWSLPELVGEGKGEWAMGVSNLVPYWMERGSGVGNRVDLRGIFLLTAPNMSGKSTLMRSLAVAALLANCGLHVPAAAGAKVPRFDNVFMRTASYDVPAEGKSAFALEMDDVRVMLRDCTSRSLILLDEIGKGTSARDGAALSGALLEALDRVPVTAVFATHLHEMFDLPLATEHVAYKRMGCQVGPQGEVSWTYLLEDGRCLDSMALHTARAYGIPEAILSRATELGREFDRVCRGEGSGDEGDGVGDGVREAMGQWELALEQAVEVMERVGVAYRDEGGERREAVVIVPAGFDSPPRLEGSACVYIVKGERGFYVGETESVRQRLMQHRKRFGAGLEMAVLPVGDKSEGRGVEAALIREMRKEGFPLISDHDGGRQVAL